MRLNQSKYLLLAVTLLVLLSLCLPGIPVFGQGNPLALSNTGTQQSVPGTEDYGLMHPTKEQLREWLQPSPGVASATIDTGIESQLKSRRLSHSVNLLPYLQYIPAERNQGHVGTCWVWAGTGLMEITLNTQMHVKDRLSVQYFDSNYNGGSGNNWAGNGGELSYLVDFYNQNGKAIPWSNTNAYYQDGSASGGASIPASDISTIPYYPISSIQEQVIPTTGISHEQAILNIKNVLQQHRAVWFAFYMANMDDWGQFKDFWGNQPETAIWNPDFSLGQTWDNGAGHAIICVGYNDKDPDNSYWIMLNSWGATSGRPDGLFRLDMNIDYDGIFYYEGAALNSYNFRTIDIDFPFDPTLSFTWPANNLSSTSATLNGNLLNLGSKTPSAVSFEYGLTSGYGSSTPSQTVGSLKKFSSQLTGLTPDTTYYYRTKAYNSVSGKDIGYGLGSKFTTPRTSSNPKQPPFWPRP